MLGARASCGEGSSEAREVVALALPDTHTRTRTQLSRFVVTSLSVSRVCVEVMCVSLCASVCVSICVWLGFGSVRTRGVQPLVRWAALVWPLSLSNLSSKIDDQPSSLTQTPRRQSARARGCCASVVGSMPPSNVHAARVLRSVCGGWEERGKGEPRGGMGPSHGSGSLGGVSGPSSGGCPPSFLSSALLPASPREHHVPCGDVRRVALPPPASLPSHILGTSGPIVKMDACCTAQRVTSAAVPRRA